ncbi:DNA polymerase III subunit gamma/tau [Candidatus Shapirobacteria bacterium]|nr:DNA polymerase III subunit gamma/tau [Candidatus Shapirobacteria bacterium]
MELKTYYLKYRPQKVSELDLDDVRESLQKILKSKKIPHAFLFSGPKGTGKTSAARIVAKTLNCPHKKDSGEPCNRCEICQEITTGSSLDLIEIDAASNRGIDDIRNLREKIKLSPAKCPYKVYIIDEVHMLTTEAFNALLKTLEEPPAHAFFILCTTEPQKLPKTIISRCLQIKFRRSTQAELIHSLTRVVKGEKLSLEKGVLEAIAPQADGSFRDAQKILDQLSSGSQKIALKETQKLLGQIEELKPEKLLAALSEREVKKALLEVDRIVNLGADLDVYLQNFLESLRVVLLKMVGLETENSELVSIPPSLTQTDVRKLLALFSQAALEMKNTSIPQLPLELAIIEWCSSKESQSEESVDAEQAHQDQVRAKIASKDSVKQNPDKESSVKGKGLQMIVDHWSDLLQGVRPLNHSVEALLRASRPLKLDNGFLILEVFYRFHKERLDTEKCRLIVEEVASQILGKPIKLKCVLGEKEKQPVKEVEDHDIIEVASEIFNGKLVD